MYNTSQNPQVQYSLPQLTRGLFYHLQHKPLNEITVTQICQQAGLTRRTFYRNCENKEDLILYACDKLIETLLADVDYSSTNAPAMYLRFFCFWYNHRVFLQSIYQSGLYHLFRDRFESVCNQRTRFPLQDEALQTQPEPERSRHFNNAFLLGGLTSMLCEWTREEFLSSSQSLVDSVLFLLPQEFRESAPPDNQSRGGMY